MEMCALSFSIIKSNKNTRVFTVIFDFIKCKYFELAFNKIFREYYNTV